MATLAAQVSDTGIIAPSYADILQQLRIQFWSIYGSDADLDDDTQDGQWIAVLAQAIYDANQTAIAVYNSFSPATAQGVGLSSVVKINGLRRLVPTNSTVGVTLIGVAGTTIENGQVGDDLGLGTVWNLPPIVNIPITGSVQVTATCTVQGAVMAAANSIRNIITPTRGWQSVDNPLEAVVGEPTESDAALRTRQSKSTAIPSLTVLEGIYAAVAAVQGVQRLKLYENDTDVTDVLGIPSHSIAVIASGGDTTGIANAIASKKTPGTGTAGTTAVIVVDQNGVPNTIRFYALTNVLLKVRVTITPLDGYVSTTGDLLRQAVVDYINSLDIGEDSYLARLYSPANLSGAGLGATYVVTLIEQAKEADPLAAANVVIAFQEAAVTDLDHVELIVA